MLHGFVANNFLPGIRQVMAFPLYFTESFLKEMGGRLGHPHQLGELTAVQQKTTEGGFILYTLTGTPKLVMVKA